VRHLKEYSVTAYDVDGNGLRTPFPIFVGIPETDEFCTPASEVFCPLLKTAKKIRVETPEQAYYLGFRFLRHIIDLPNRILICEDGTRFDLPEIDVPIIQGCYVK